MRREIEEEKEEVKEKKIIKGQIETQKRLVKVEYHRDIKPFFNEKKYIICSVPWYSVLDDLKPN
jgi:hypothetical protein